MTEFFGITTRILCRRPKLLRALLRAAASGDPALAGRVAHFHVRSTEWVVAALRESPVAESHAESADEREQTVALLLQQVWFALLVGWAAGVHTQAAIAQQIRNAAEILLRGAEIA